MSEGIKSLATTAGYFAPGAGVLDALGMYPDENSQSMLANLKAGELGRAGMQGLGALGDALLLTGVGAPIGASMKMVSNMGRAGKALRSQASRVTDDILKRQEPLTFKSKVNIQGKDYDTSSDLLKIISPKKLDVNKSQIGYSSEVLKNYAKKNPKIAGVTEETASKYGSEYIYLQKDVGLGFDKPATIGIRISDHAPTGKYAGGAGTKRFKNAEVKINIGPKGQVNSAGEYFDSRTLNEALEMIDNLHINKKFLSPTGKVSDDITDPLVVDFIGSMFQKGAKPRLKHLNTGIVEGGKLKTKKPPLDLFHQGGSLPFGVNVNRF